MAVVNVEYSALVAGDIVREWGTSFQVVEVKSFPRRDRVVWWVMTVAVSEPSHALQPFVKAVGDEWVLQGSAPFAMAQLVVPEERTVDLTDFAEELGRRFLSF